jgi:hypothetical protein
MNEDRSRARLRQAVLVAGELEPAAKALRDGLGLGEPFRDPGVAEFGLANAVFALGDCFLEIVSPTQPDTTAGRYLERHGGDGGYMAIFDLEDLDGALARAEQLGVRVVWRIELPDISGNHLHPADMRGAIVSLDRSDPYGSWRWGGPEWTGQTGHGAAAHLAGITVAVHDPVSVSARWAQVLGVPVSGGESPVLALDGAEVAFVAAPDQAAEGLIEIAVELPPEVRRERDAIDLGRARVALLDGS